MTPNTPMTELSEELMATRNREERMVVVERDEAGMPTVWCDPEIVDLVKALNAGGVPTIASCSGHGHRPGSIALKDGRWLVVAKDDAEHDQIEAIFPTDINGDPIIRQSDTRIEGGGWREFRPEEDLPPTGQVEVRWRDADIASSRTAINDAAAIGWQYVSWWRPAAPPSSPVNKSPETEHVEGDVLSVGEMEVVAWECTDLILGGEPSVITDVDHAAMRKIQPKAWTVEDLVRASSVQSRIQRAERERDEALKLAREYQRQNGKEPVVKRLEWIDMGEGPRCITVCGAYAIYPSTSRGRPTLSLSGMPKGLFGKFASIEEAKAAAQADYDARIRSALSGDTL